MGFGDGLSGGSILIEKQQLHCAQVSSLITSQKAQLRVPLSPGPVSTLICTVVGHPQQAPLWSAKFKLQVDLNT